MIRIKKYPALESKDLLNFFETEILEVFQR